MIASVAVDISLPHLDRFFDYQVPPKWADDAVVGARVRVRFSGQLLDGFIVDLPQASQAPGKLLAIERVISPEPVLSPAQVRLLRAVADHYAGVFADVVRLAVPPRHGATEKANQRQWPAPKTGTTPTGGLRHMPDGLQFLAALSQAKPVRAHWLVPTAFRSHDDERDDWVAGFAQAAAATLSAGRGVIVVVPDAADVATVRQRLAAHIGLGAIAELHSNLGPAARYRNYLAISRGQARIVVGSRAAVYAPVHDLGLVALWDDGDDLLADQHAPYPHARAVAALRANLEQCALLFASHARTAEVQQWLERGWLAAIELPASQARRNAPLVRAAADSDLALQRDPNAPFARLPKLAFEVIRAGLAAGPVLVQVARGGYLASLSCQHCRSGVRCPTCQGPVRMAARRDDADTGLHQLSCGWCGRIVTGWRCPVCGSTQLRAPVVGSQRTGEELGRAFPGHRVITSSGDKVVAEVSTQPALVVATPGAEPVPTHGYAAAVLLDGAQMLARPDLRTGEETLRRWLNAVALVRPGSDGGTVCIVAPSMQRPVQALVRNDPAGFASRELADRLAAGFPPAHKLVVVDSTSDPASDFSFDAPAGVDVLGPVQLAGRGGGEELRRLILRTDLAGGAALVRAVKAATATRSARKQPAVRVIVDPQAL